MRLINLLSILLLFSLGTVPVFSQYSSAIINDTDGFTNVRSHIDNSKIVGKIIEGEIFEYDADDWFEKKDWIHVSINKGNNKDKCNYLGSKLGIGGSMHRSRITLLSDLPSTFQRSILDNEVKLTVSNFSVSIKTRTLSKKENKELYYKCVWGTDTGEPKNVIQELSVLSGAEKIIIPKEDYVDLYRINLINSHLKTHKGYTYITMSNSDAAGSYEVTWVLKDNKYIRRFICIGP